MNFFRDRNNIYRVLSVIAALVIWQLAAMRVNMDMLLASPVRVLERLCVIWREEDFLSTVLYSSLRVCGGFLIAFVLGVVLGIFAGRFRAVEYILKPYVNTVKAVPVASFIILCLIWMDFTKLTMFISVIIAFPVIYSNVAEGIRSADKKMLEMAEIYRMSPLRKLVYIYLPSVKPFLISASSVAVGMAWKSGVAAEVIGMADGSIGNMLYEAKVYFSNADLLCWTVVILLLSVITEKLFILLLKSVFRGIERL